MSQAVNPELIAELQDVIDALGREVLSAKQELLHKGVRPERINAMFRHGHTLKGLFAMAGHVEAQHLAHNTEDLLESMRMGRAVTGSETLAVLLDCVDHFSRAADGDSGVPSEASKDGKLEALMARLHQLSSGTPAAAPSCVAGDAPAPEASSCAAPPGAAQQLPQELRRMLTEYEEYRFEQNRREGRHVMAAAVSLSLMDCDTALPILEAQLGALGEIIARLPSAQLGADGSIAFEILMAADTEAQQVAKALGRPDVSFKILTSGAAAQPAVMQAPGAAAPAPLGISPVKDPEAPQVAEATGVAKPNQTVRVDIRRLDHLMHLVGELHTTRNVLSRLAGQARHISEAHGLAVELEREGNRLERRISVLQAQVLEARMVPLATLFDRLVRAGTKVALELGIKAQFETVGGHTELDKRIVEELADPLLHLMRNAIDHGLEKPQARLLSGKPECGTVKLWAEAQGSHVVVGVSDDGGGMDGAQVGAAALARGLLTPERLAEMSYDERLRLILLPGFSTRDEVSEYSGRGVGLDVVKTHLERLGGGVEITTQKGMGSSFTLMAPVTLAIIPALVVVADHQSYAIPLAHVVETVGLEPHVVGVTQGLPTLQLRDSTLTLTPLTQLLGQQPAHSKAQEPFAVIVGLAGRQTAVAVSDVVGQKDIVIKTLGPRLSHLRGISGAAQIDDGAMLLVLDVMALALSGRPSAVAESAAKSWMNALGSPGPHRRREAP